MRIFSQSVDFRSRKAMTEFLQHHFRYFTMNSWNHSTSYACNLKIYNLGLDNEIENKLYELMESQEFFDAQRELLNEFNENHQYLWQVNMNGRSGGYLVLYQGEQKPSGYKSYCSLCGQHNYRLITETDNICGVCNQPSRVDFKRTHMQINIFPGRGIDTDSDFEDWSMHDLKERVRLVQELDRFADHMRENAIYFAKNYTAEEEEYYIPQKRMVLVENAV